VSLYSTQNAIARGSEILDYTMRHAFVHGVQVILKRFMNANAVSEAAPAHVCLAVLSSQAEIESPKAVPGPHAGLTRTDGRSATLVLHDLRTSQRIDYARSHVEQMEVAE
jgi:hypothetical protein